MQRSFFLIAFFLDEREAATYHDLTATAKAKKVGNTRYRVVACVHCQGRDMLQVRVGPGPGPTSVEQHLCYLADQAHARPRPSHGFLLLVRSDCKLIHPHPPPPFSRARIDRGAAGAARGGKCLTEPPGAHKPPSIRERRRFCWGVWALAAPNARVVRGTEARKRSGLIRRHSSSSYTRGPT